VKVGVGVSTGVIVGTVEDRVLGKEGNPENEGVVLGGVGDGPKIEDAGGSAGAGREIPPKENGLLEGGMLSNMDEGGVGAGEGVKEVGATCAPKIDGGEAIVGPKGCDTVVVGEEIIIDVDWFAGFPKAVLVDAGVPKAEEEPNVGRGWGLVVGVTRDPKAVVVAGAPKAGGVESAPNIEEAGAPKAELLPKAEGWVEDGVPKEEDGGGVVEGAPNAEGDWIAEVVPKTGVVVGLANADGAGAAPNTDVPGWGVETFPNIEPPKTDPGCDVLPNMEAAGDGAAAGAGAGAACAKPLVPNMEVPGCADVAEVPKTDTDGAVAAKAEVL
jgi:hypothetical protein